MNLQELKTKAQELLEPFERRYYATLSDVYWVRQDNHDIDGDFCDKYISKAVKAERKSLKDNRKLVLDKFRIIKETGKYNGKKIKVKYTEADLNKAKNYELKKLGKSKFDYTYNYGDGYESSSFNTCNICEKELNICILPDTENITDVLQDLKDGVINDQTGYRAYCLIYNTWNENDKKHEREVKLSIKLAQRIINILEVNF